nr:hypothetical protein [Desulfobulbaceae bacterium]
MRPKHIACGLLVFAAGLYLLLTNILYCVEFIKGAAQPFLIIIGLLAAASAIFTSKTNRTINILVAIVFLLVGSYGVYDEYYATMDFFHGLIPPLFVGIGIICLVHGISRLNK